VIKFLLKSQVINYKSLNFAFIFIYGKIFKNIEAIRKEKGLNQEVIAELLGVSQPAYSNWITRNHDMTYSRLSQIANILEVSVIDIITYPKRYIDADSIMVENDTGKVAILFEVPSNNRELLLNIVKSTTTNKKYK
jgi:transcriptional regulator with XRE-family HTH domain